MNVQGPGGIVVQFPDGTDAATIDKVMRQATGAAEVPASNDQGAAAAGALHWANQTLGGFGPQAAGAIQGILDVTGLDQHRGGVDRAAPGVTTPQTTAELAAALRPGGYRPSQTIGSFTGGYNQTVDEANRALDETAAQHPIASTVGDIGGGVTLASMIPGRAIASGLGIAGKAGTFAARVGEGFAGGAGYGAIAGAGNTQGDLGERLKGGLEGLLTGGVTGIASPYIAAGTRGLGRAVADKAGAYYRGTVAEAADRVVRGFRKDAGGEPNRVVDVMTKARQAGQPILAADVGEYSRALGRSAANTSPEARATFAQALEGRQESQVDRAKALVRSAAPGVLAGPEVKAVLKAAGRKANAPAYKKAYAAGDRPIDVGDLIGSPMMVDAMREAATRGKDRAIAEGYGAFNPGVKVTPDGQVIFTKGKSGVPTYPNLQFWDYTQRELRDIADKASRAGENERAGVAQNLRHKLIAQLDQQVPDFAKARSTAAAFFGAQDASEAGAKFVTMRADKWKEAEAAHALFSPAEKQLFADNFAESLINQFEEGFGQNSNRNLINSVFLKGGAPIKRIEVALGKGAANKMEAFLRLEKIKDITKRKLLDGSQTAQFLTELGLAGAGGVAGIATSGWDPQAIITGALTYGLLKGGKGLSNRVNTRIAKEVARLLASDDPKVVKDAINLVTGSPRLLKAVRLGEGYITSRLVRGATVPLVGSLSAASPELQQ